ncbi:MAG: hypothetical protein FJ280_03690 [Planctomycetes bacterium]|nr:hypothetical protein [Planctomycetota bacterium]
MGRIRLTANWNAALALGLTALLAVVGRAADPNLPAKPAEVEAPVAPARPDPPKPPAPRPPASLTRQTPLSEAIDILQNATTPPLRIVVLWKPLGEAGIYRDTPIGLDGVAGLRAGQFLDVLMLSLSAGASARLGYAARDGVITISTVDTLPVSRPVARIYDISDLVAAPARYSLPSLGFATGYGGPMMPVGGYAGSLGRGPGTAAPRTSGRAGQNPRPARGR